MKERSVPKVYCMQTRLEANV